MLTFVGDAARPSVLGFAAGIAVGWWCCCCRGHSKANQQNVPEDHPNEAVESAAATAGQDGVAGSRGQPRSKPGQAPPRSTTGSQVGAPPRSERDPPKLAVTPREALAGYEVERGKVWEGTVCTVASEERASRTGRVAHAVRRRVLCGDALEYLGSCDNGGIGGHVLTSLPCRDELSNLRGFTRLPSRLAPDWCGTKSCASRHLMLQSQTGGQGTAGWHASVALSTVATTHRNQTCCPIAATCSGPRPWDATRPLSRAASSERE